MTNEERDEHKVNLWECLTHKAGCKQTLDFQKDVFKKLLENIANAGNSGQEITLEATEEGWLVEVFSCYGGEGAKVLFPKEGGIKIVKEDPFA